MAYKAKQPRVYISQRGGRKKIHKDKFVYLKNDDIFEIEIENPTTDTVLAKIELNGKSLSNTGLVLRPGERFVLKRFIDEDRTFKFNTYDIDGASSEMVEAIAANGKLKVNFYKEEKVQPLCNPCVWINPFPYNPPVDNPPFYYNNPGTYNTDVYCSNNLGDLSNGSATTTIGSATTGNADINNAFYSQASFTSGTGHSLGDIGLEGVLRGNTFSDEQPAEATLDSLEDELSLETGRVEKGNKSNQEFDYVDMDFESSISYTTELQILPESRKLVEKADLNKTTYCHKCARKAKDGDLYCASCGVELYK